MTPGALLAALEGHGIELFIKDGFLKYRAPAVAYNSAFREEVRVHRQTLINEWMCPHCLHIGRVFYGFPRDLRCGRCL